MGELDNMADPGESAPLSGTLATTPNQAVLHGNQVWAMPKTQHAKAH
jgi:hypothetical protein